MLVRRFVVVLVAVAAALTGGVDGARAASAPTGPDGQWSPATFTYPDTYGETASAPHTFTLTSTGDQPLVVSGAAFLQPDDPDLTDAFQISASTCDGVTLDPGDTCTVTVFAYPEALGQNGSLLIVHDNSTGGQHSAQLLVTGLEPATGLYYPVTPSRVLDTRDGTGTGKAPVTAGHTVRLQLGGHAGMPATGMAAVVLNVTVTHTTASGYVSAFPAGTTRPTISNLSYPAHWTGASTLTVPVSAAGAIDLFVSRGSVDLIADVQGWYAAALTVPGSYGPGRAYDVTPEARVLDTRDVHGAHLPLAPGETRDVVVTSRANPDADIVGLVLNVTATNVRATGYLSVGTVGSDLTATSLLNLRPDDTTTNLAQVMTTPCTDPSCPPSSTYYKSVRLAVHNGSTRAVDVLMDTEGALYGEYDGDLRYHPRTPTRIVDTRDHLGTGRLGADSAHTVKVPSAVATNKQTALVATVTAVHPTRQTYVTVWPGGSDPRPATSIVNPAAGTVVATSTLIRLSDPTANGKAFAAYNHAGSTDLLVDVTGVFDFFLPVDPII